MKESIARGALGKAALALTLLLVFCFGSRLAAGPPVAEWGGDGAAKDCCFDCSAHKVTFVSVQPGVRLEVLDWGGTGDPMVLLTGLGDNAHVFDQFAYQWTDRFRVLGITRRGFGRSSKPAGGYDVDTRARDDVRVLNYFNIPAAVFVGHSFAGDELSKLGAVYPDRVKKLVYLDALDFGVHSTLTPPPTPEFTEADLASVEHYASATARYFGQREPNAAICQTFRLDAAGRIVENRSPPEISEAMRKGSQQARYDRITAPALGIFATWTPQTRLPLYYYLSAAQQAEFNRTFPPIVAWQMDAIERFRHIRNSRVVELPGADHYIYLNNEAVVVREMRKFLLGAVR